MLNHIQIDKATTTERVTTALRAEILAGRLASGQVVSEVSVSQDLGISRNTLREAVQQLEFEGLLSWKGNRRIVTVPSLEDVRDIYKVRLLLETGGLEASRHATAEEIQALETALTNFEKAALAHDRYAVVEQNIAFHGATVAFMRSPRLSASYELAMRQMHLALIFTELDLDDQTEQIRIHRDIVDVVKRGQIERGIAMLRHNYMHAEADVLRSLTAQTLATPK